MSDRISATSLARLSSSKSGFLACLIGIMAAAPAAAAETCKPALAFREVQFSAMQASTLQRKWTALVSIDASRCKPRSTGYFEIVFERLKENAPDIQFRQEFMWLDFDWIPPVMKVEVDFAADEVVQGYWFDTITPCPCAGTDTRPLAAAPAGR
jgi:hypothetical protein